MIWKFEFLVIFIDVKDDRVYSSTLLQDGSCEELDYDKKWHVHGCENVRGFDLSRDSVQH